MDAVLHLEPGADPIAGWLKPGAGPALVFTGWLELVAALETMQAPPLPGRDGVMRFGLEAPSDWTASDDGEIVEVEPPDGNGAAHVSSMVRDPEPVAEGDADAMLDDFLEGKTLSDVDREPERAHGDGRIAFVRYTVDDADAPHWLAAMILTPERAVLCTFNHSGDGARHEADARRMFEGLRP